MKLFAPSGQLEARRIFVRSSWSGLLFSLLFLAACASYADPISAPGQSAESPVDIRKLTWPATTGEQRPWAYWWWMASAVDQPNLTRELTRYRDAGLGGVHIIPIYGAKGWETNYIPYLSAKWLEALRFTVTEAHRLGLGVDMTTGTGWCFGGPRVTDNEANASVVWKMFDVAAGEKPPGKFDTRTLQTLMAFGADEKRVDLTDKITLDGTVNWTAAGGSWRIYAVSQKPSGQKVKRAAPGGEGHMLNLAYLPAMTNYLRWFDAAFAQYDGPRPRAQYHDSYEYKTDWSPDFFAQFEKRRGYRLQDELPALFHNQPADRAARVKTDYRETISDLMVEDTLPAWADWSRRNGFLTRNEAHGSPGNWLDLYATADIPETEMFYQDRSKLISKFASSAAHTTGKPLVSSETGTWLNEHFTETLADMKYLLDDLFLSGVNHVFYHGTCYSPDEAGWPGWLFYASFEMNPRNSIWRDVPALNAYAMRCQSLLQAGRPDNDILLYWPLHDFWHNPEGLTRNLTVHARDWFENQPIGRTAASLWVRGYSFDYVSDRQLAPAKVVNGDVQLPGGQYRVVVVPACEHLPLATFGRLLTLAGSGATVIFANQLPADVPGLGGLEARRAGFRNLLGQLGVAESTEGQVKVTKLRHGRVLVGDLEAALALARVAREPMFDHDGLMCIRRAYAGGRTCFIANRSEKHPVDGWIPLAHPAQSVGIMDPLTGRTGVAACRRGAAGATEVRLQLAAGESVMLRCLADGQIEGAPWLYWETPAATVALAGPWQVKFIAGGPELPAPFTTDLLRSWAALEDTNSQRFAGTALYTLKFDAPPANSVNCLLDLGQVCQSARVRLNGRDLGTLLTPPFRVMVNAIKPKENILEVEVTNVSANRIRDLDRRGVKWKNFRDINIVSITYKPFDASNWLLTDSGLLGPVTLAPVKQSTR
jgi:hypothetical protein